MNETFGWARPRRRLGIGVAVATLVFVAAAIWVNDANAGVAPRGAVARILAMTRKTMRSDHLRAVIVRVTDDGRPILSRATGSSMTGVPATPAMHFRNGGVAFSYVSTLMMEFVDEHKLKLSDPIVRWLPGLPDARHVTVKMLANMTSGYPDFESDPTFLARFDANPFRDFSYRERLGIAFTRPVSFAPGTNWGYAHTNYMILGRLLSKVGHAPLAKLIRQKVLEPLHLTHTVASQTASIPSPVLHAYSAERAPAFGVKPVSRLYEDSTFWNAAWGTPAGATETTDITDLTRTAVGIGTGKLLSRASYRAQVAPNLLGFGHAQDGCSCAQQTVGYNYGLGIVRSGDWLLQNPLLDGYGAVEAYLPSKRIAIAVAVTFNPGAFGPDGSYPNASDTIFREIGAYLAPNDAPPVKR